MVGLQFSYIYIKDYDCDMLCHSINRSIDYPGGHYDMMEILGTFSHLFMYLYSWTTIVLLLNETTNECACSCVTKIFKHEKLHFRLYAPISNNDFFNGPRSSQVESKN